MIEINPREIAAQALVQIMENGAYNNMALRSLLKQNGALSAIDKNLVTEIVNGTLRNIYYIDYVLNQFSKIKTEKMKPWVVAVLRSAVYQIHFMKIPDSAACNEGVKLLEKRGLEELKGFVNGVLRNVARNKETLSLPQKDSPEFLSIMYSHPLWLVKMWIAYYGYEQTQEICKVDNIAPDVSVRGNNLKTSMADLKSTLEDNGVVVKDGLYIDDAFHLKATSDLGKLSGFTQGLFHVQDESSQLAIQVLDPQKNEKILDICGAPGGKTFTICERMENQGQVVSCDIFPHKLELIEEGAQRLGISIIEVKLQDGTEYNPEFEETFHRVLVDAPCSGLGLMRKKPDIRMKKSGEEIDALIGIQRSILENSGKYVKKDGILVYSTCTLSKKENEKNIEWFLKEYPEFILEDISHRIPQGVCEDTGEKGYITLLPHQWKIDGFFIARMRRKELK